MQRLKLNGEVERPAEWSFDDLVKLAEAWGVIDVSRLEAKRKGDAVRLEDLLAAVGVKASATHLGLHASADNFHASIPLGPIRDRAVLIFRVEGQPLDVKAGGPFRFFIRDYLACHSAEIDECANVKFVDHLELTAGRGFDNRPHDDAEHAKLHQEG